MSDKCKDGCNEYNRLSRRRFLSLSTAGLVAAATPGWLPRVVLAESENSERDVLVSLFLRGGADALSLCVPHAEASYYQLRPTLAIPAPGGGPDAATDLDGFFGLPPAMAALVEAYQDNALAIVHACGSLDPTRSHFSAMYAMEVGQPQPPGSLFTGWLGRHLQMTAPTQASALLRAIGIGFGLPRTLVGAPSAIPVADFDNFGLAGDPATEAERQAAIEVMYAAVPDPISSAAAANVKTIELLEEIDFASYQPAGGAVYPEDELGYAFRSTAALIKADKGVEAVTIDAGGWDTHDFQAPIGGTMAARMESLSGSLAAFHKDLFTSGREDVLVTAMSEFGRNVAENGSQGTDHGHGGLMLVLGGAVAGGRVISEWPGLAPGQLYEGRDLAVTIDYRDVIAELATKRLANPDTAGLFPDPAYTPVDRGIIA